MADLVKTVGGIFDEAVAAAWLHDVLEDTTATLALVHDNFGPVVAGCVDDLTDKFVERKHGNRKLRKKLEAERLAKCPPIVHTIKYADLISNTCSIIDYDPDFAKVYLEEKAYLLDIMTKGDNTLREIAIRQVEQRNFL